MANFEESLKSRARFKTRLRTVRLPVAIDAALEEEAGKRGMTMNSFVVSILERYDKWDKLAEKFHFIGFPRDLIRDSFAALNDATTIKRMAKTAGGRVPREMMLFWFKEVNLESFLKYLALQSEFQGYAEYEVLHRGERVVIIAKHDLGPRWSAWLEGYLGEAIRANLGVVPQIESSENSVKFEFETHRA